MHHAIIKKSYFKKQGPHGRLPPQNTEIENSIRRPPDYGRRITDNFIGRRVRILSHEQNLPKGHRLTLGDMATVTL